MLRRVNPLTLSVAATATMHSSIRLPFNTWPLLVIIWALVGYYLYQSSVSIQYVATTGHYLGISRLLSVPVVGFHSIRGHYWSLSGHQSATVCTSSRFPFNTWPILAIFWAIIRLISVPVFGCHSIPGH